MNKRIITFATLVVCSVVSLSAGTTVKVGNFSNHDISDLRVKVKFEDANGKKAKGSVHAFVAKDHIVEVDLTAATNKETKADGSSTGWSKKNPGVSVLVSDRVDMNNLKSVKIVKAQPKGFYSRAKNSNKKVDVIVVKDNPKDKYKTLKDGSKAMRLLKVKFR